MVGSESTVCKILQIKMVSILPVSISTSNSKMNIYKNIPQKHDRAVTESMTEEVVRHDFPWVKDKNILLALNELKQITFDKNEVAALKKIGVEIPFESGEDAVKFLKKSNVRIVFDDMAADIHAQYDFSKNFVKINKLYKDTLNTAEILAIAESILHEAGHAKDNDNKSSIQEELNFLGANALAHRDLQRRYPNMFKTSDSLIVQDGVSVYERLFFDSDPEKKALIRRLQIKYGYLPAGDVKHPPSKLALKAKGL